MAPKGPPYGIPDGFPDLLQRFVVHVLKNQPDNLVHCAIKYFVSMRNEQLPDSKIMSYLSMSNNENSDDQQAHLNQMSECLIAASQQALSNPPSKSNAVSVDQDGKLFWDSSCILPRLQLRIKTGHVKTTPVVTGY